MIEENAYGTTLAQAYHNALWLLYEYGNTVPCPDYNTTQQELSMTIHVAQPFKEPMISKLFIGGPRELEQYRQEMLDGILDFEIEKGKWPYTYHSRMAKQIPFIIQELQRNPDSRRAVIDIRSPEDMDSADPACLQHIQFFIREGKLHCKVLFRSNDACKATFMNAFALIMLQKRIADSLGVSVGSYTHRANSFHCYEKDLPMLKGYVLRIENDNNTTYDFAGEWDELMAEAQPDIARMVEELKHGR